MEEYYEFIDAKTFASWGVDFLKYDHCYKPTSVPSELLYKKMGIALRNSGRDILYSACSWGVNETYKWIKSTSADMWRTTPDIFDSWESINDLYNKNKEILGYNSKGCFGDMDMLVVGMHGKGNVANGGCSDIEYRTHFALWCLFQSPLMIGGDLRKMDPEMIELLKNKELLSILNDPEARPPRKMAQQYPQEQWIDRHVFFKHVANNEYILALFNFHDSYEAAFKIELYDLGITVASGYGLEGYEIFTGEKTGVVKNFFEANVPVHDCKIYRVKLAK